MSASVSVGTRVYMCVSACKLVFTYLCICRCILMSVCAHVGDYICTLRARVRACVRASACAQQFIMMRSTKGLHKDICKEIATKFTDSYPRCLDNL